MLHHLDGISVASSKAHEKAPMREPIVGADEGALVVGSDVVGSEVNGAVDGAAEGSDEVNGAVDGARRRWFRR